MQAYLRVKIKTLAAEAVIIRNDELKWKRRAAMAREKQRTNAAEKNEALRASLYHHRYTVVRPETRASQLAYGFIRGEHYSTIERTIREDNAPDFKRIEAIVKTFTKETPWTETAQKFEEWAQAAQTHVMDVLRDRKKAEKAAKKKAPVSPPTDDERAAKRRAWEEKHGAAG